MAPRVPRAAPLALVLLLVAAPARARDFSAVDEAAGDAGASGELPGAGGLGRPGGRAPFPPASRGRRAPGRRRRLGRAARRGRPRRPGRPRALPPRVRRAPAPARAPADDRGHDLRPRLAPPAAPPP